ncbi:hypothetical protein [Sporosarcina sp. SAFN-010]|uniref:hypothetical protein n=1 Tax=Sporosarcina sp. SAFN-010 TaxID=3387273 RepID=UPI003F804292
MAEEFMMFDSVDGDREVTAADFAKYYTEILTNGVFHRNGLPSLRLTKGAGLTTSVEIGAAFIEGYMYRNTAPIELLHAVGNPSYPRIDRVVVRLDRTISKRYVRVFVKEGVPATTPQPPVLQRDDFVYELSLAQVRVSAGVSAINSVTDERMDQELCGVVSSIIQVPTSAFLLEWRDFFDATVASLDVVVANYKKTLADNKAAADQSLTEYVAKLEKNLAGYGTEFSNWLAQQQTKGFVLGGFRVYIGPTPPANPSQYDRWVDTSK